MSARRPPTRAVLPVTVLVVALAAALVASACGIRTDDRPRALPVTTTSTIPSTTPAPAGPVDTILWFVQDQDLIPASRAVTDRGLATRLTALLDPGAELEGDLSSSIPLGTELRDVELVGDRITIDLSGAFDELAGTARQLALGQLVLTATQDDSARTVQFLVEGEPVLAGTPQRGDVDVVTVCDFATLLPPVDVATTERLSTSSAEQLTTRRAEVTSQCG